MATPKRQTGRYFKDKDGQKIRFALYEYDFPTLELAKEFITKFSFAQEPGRTKIVMRYRKHSLPVWDVYVNEKDGEKEDVNYG